MGEIVKFSDIQDQARRTRKKTGEASNIPDDFSMDARSVGSELIKTAERLRNNTSYDAGFDFLDLHDDINGFIDTIFANEKKNVEERIEILRKGLQDLIAKALE